jgi:hypothetical protein
MMKKQILTFVMKDSVVFEISINSAQLLNIKLKVVQCVGV